MPIVDGKVGRAGATPREGVAAEWLVHRLRKLKPGERLELRGLGRSLWPLLRSGERVLVESARPNDLRRGDLVIAWLKRRHTLVCHVVVDVNQVRTAPLFGEDDGEVEVVARVARTQSRFAWIGWCARTPAVVLALRGMGRFARRAGWTARVRQAVEELQSLSFSAGLREEVLAPFDVRRLTPRDIGSLAVFTGHRLPSLSAEWLEAQFLEDWRHGAGGAFAAFDRRNNIRAFGYLGHYAEEGVDVPGIWLRSLYVEPFARRLGLSRRLIDARIELALEQGFDEVYADIYRDNVRSLQLHLKHGFVEVPSDSLAPFEPLLSRAKRRGRDLVILRWTAPRASPQP